MNFALSASNAKSREFSKKTEKVFSNFVFRLEDITRWMSYVARKEEMKSKFLSSQPINEIKS